MWCEKEVKEEDVRGMRGRVACGDNVICESTDYYTLRVGGLVFAGVIVFLSIFLLAGESTATFSDCVFVNVGSFYLTVCNW